LRPDGVGLAQGSAQLAQALLRGAVASPQHETTLKMLQGEPSPK